MNISKRLIAAAAASALALAACGQADNTPADAPSTGESITVEHSQGTTTLDGYPESIVVLDLGALDTIDALGAGDKVVGVPKGTNLPEASSAYAGDDIANVGTAKEPDLEAIAEINPDLIVVGFRTAALYPELSKNFKTIDVTFDQTEVGFYEGIESSTNILATALGAEEQAEAELKEVADALAAAEEKAPEGESAMIVMTSGGKISLQGPDSRFGIVHKEMGLDVALDPSVDEAHGDALSFEALAEANPDRLFVIDRDAAVGQDGENAETILDNELVANTNAWKNDNVTYLDGGRWYLLIHGVNNAVELINEASEKF